MRAALGDGVVVAIMIGERRSLGEYDHFTVARFRERRDSIKSRSRFPLDDQFLPLAQ